MKEHIQISVGPIIGFVIGLIAFLVARTEAKTAIATGVLTSIFVSSIMVLFRVFDILKFTKDFYFQQSFLRKKDKFSLYALKYSVKDSTDVDETAIKIRKNDDYIDFWYDCLEIINSKYVCLTSVPHENLWKEGRVKKILNIHRLKINEKCNITRIILVDNFEDIDVLKDEWGETAWAQARLGIKVRYVIKSKLSPNTLRIIKQLHTDDFAIVDEDMVFLTILKEKKIERAELHKDIKKYEKAKRVIEDAFAMSEPFPHINFIEKRSHNLGDARLIRLRYNSEMTISEKIEFIRSYTDLVKNYVCRSKKSICVYEYLGKGNIKIPGNYLKTYGKAHTKIFRHIEDRIKENKHIKYARLLALPISDCNEQWNEKSFEKIAPHILKQCSVPVFEHICICLKKFSSEQVKFYIVNKPTRPYHYGIIDDKFILTEYYKYSKDGHFFPDLLFIEEVYGDSTSSALKTHYQDEISNLMQESHLLFNDVSKFKNMTYSAKTMIEKESSLPEENLTEEQFHVIRQHIRLSKEQLENNRIELKAIAEKHRLIVQEKIKIMKNILG